MKDHLELHRATRVLPIISPPIYDGIVVLEKGIVKEVGLSNKILKSYSKSARKYSLIEHEQGVILPCLVNAHTHLELSCLSNKITPKGDFFDWI